MTNLPLQMQDYSRFGDRRIELFDFYTICELISSTRILHNLHLYEMCSVQASHAERYRLEDGRDCWERSDAAFSRLWTRRTTCNGHSYRFPVQSLSTYRDPKLERYVYDCRPRRDV